MIMYSITAIQLNNHCNFCQFNIILYCTPNGVLGVITIVPNVMLPLFMTSITKHYYNYFSKVVTRGLKTISDRNSYLYNSIYPRPFHNFFTVKWLVKH